MRNILSIPRRHGRVRVTRRPRSSRIGAVVGASRAITNPMAIARMRNQIANPKVDAIVGVQAVAEVVNNTSTRIVRQI
jgi:hypothetical protein